MTVVLIAATAAIVAAGVSAAKNDEVQELVSQTIRPVFVLLICAGGIGIGLAAVVFGGEALVNTLYSYLY